MVVKKCQILKYFTSPLAELYQALKMLVLKVQDLMVLTALLLSITGPTETRVVTSLQACHNFFCQQTPPNIPGILAHGNIINQNRYKPICQTFENTVTFVTLYDTTNKIPVFSAYKYTQYATGRPRDIWMIEPQLENLHSGNNMEIPERNKSYQFQATPDDYDTSQNYQKGHLLPNSFGSNMNVKQSTFTLTNAVPQVDKFNTVAWRIIERDLKSYMGNYCVNNNDQIEAYVVIGAQPGTDNKFLNGKIKIPSILWSAFCCYSKSTGTWLTSAQWGKNTDHPELQSKTLNELYHVLGHGFDLFPNTQCPRDCECTLSGCKRPRSS
ncbi:endonuclease domain-containing 1 protein isoform X1 [Nothobranchius furzeri]|uniref:Endonuclease domain-containing 1 protein-like n=2 Tax=Nothobranchius furzeri TaxID=105023 RepID=A0A9D2Z521_NOTFU|nr:endonuclease domain-containing 1 protein-like [Nothobranchius furzeri]